MDLFAFDVSDKGRAVTHSYSPDRLGNERVGTEADGAGLDARFVFLALFGDVVDFGVRGGDLVLGAFVVVFVALAEVGRLVFYVGEKSFATLLHRDLSCFHLLL